MAFPSSPTINQTVTEAGRTYIWTGAVWNLVSTVAGHAATHASGAADALSLDASQITSGTVAEARLPAVAINHFLLMGG